MTDFQRWCQHIKPIVDAGADGKEVEVQGIFSGKWYDKADGGLASNVDYRVKPTSKYRPFTLEESGKLLQKKLHHEIYGPVKAESVLTTGLIVMVYDKGGMNSVDLVTVLGRFTFADTGLPCGVLVEEGQ